MKKIFYGVLVVVLSLAFLSACDDSRKKLADEEIPVCDDLNGNSVCDIDEPPPETVTLKCFDMTDIGVKTASKVKPLLDRGILYAGEIPEDLIIAATGRKCTKHECPPIKDDLIFPTRKVGFPGSFDTEKNFMEIRKLAAKKAIIEDEAFIDEYVESEGTYYIHDSIFDAEAEYEFEIVEMAGTKNLFSPEGKCFFIADPEGPVVDDEE